MLREPKLLLLELLASLSVVAGLSLIPSHAPADTNTINFYVATNGNDNWSGKIAGPNAAKTDGPFATLDKARDEIRRLKSNGPIDQPVTVNLRQGAYLLSKPFVLDERDSGKQGAPITYQSWPGERATLTAGIVVAPKWQIYKQGAHNTYVADLDPAIKPFNSLFVDGTRATRARTPNEGSFFTTRYDAKLIGTNGKTQFAYFPGDINPAWTRVSDMQVVSLQSWRSPRYFLNTIDAEKVTIKGSNPAASGKGGFYSGYDGTTQYFIDNVFEGLDAPGEWYLNTASHQVFYIPREGSDISKSVFVVPTGNQLVDIAPHSPINYDISDGFSISLWVKTTSTTSQMYILGNAGGANGIRFGLSGGRMRSLIGNVAGYQEKACGSKVLNDGKWHMISATFDLVNRKTSCYSDGALELTVSLPSSYNGFNASLPTIGNPPCCNAYVGSVDEVKMYSRVLSAEEIDQLHNFQEIRNGTIFSLSFDSAFDSPSGQDDYNFWEYAVTTKLTDEGIAPGEGVKGKGFYFSGDEAIRFTNWHTQMPSYINFNSLSFAYTDWAIDADGYYCRQAGIEGTDMSPSAIRTFNTSDIAISGCSLSNLGGYAIADRFSNKLSLSNNHLYDLGAGGIMIREDRPISDIDSSWNNHTIANNKIHDLGTVFADGGVGILVMQSANNHIARNTIFNSTYSGMSVGWSWSFEATKQSNNLVEGNIVHDAMQLLDDGSGIYSNGRQDGTVYRNNIIYDILPTPQHPSPHWLLGFYADDGSSGITVKNNLIVNTGVGLWVRKFENSKAQNNIIYNANLNYTPVCAPIPGTDHASGNVFDHNVIYMKKGLSKVYQVAGSCGLPAYSDYNLFDNQTDTLSQLSVLTSAGLDNNSALASPRFENPDNGDFCLKPDSPAWSLGFQAFDNCKIPAREDFDLAGPDISNTAEVPRLGPAAPADLGIRGVSPLDTQK